MVSRVDYRIEDLSPQQRRTMLAIMLLRWGIILGMLVCAITLSSPYIGWVISIGFALLILNSIGMRIFDARIRRAIAHRNAN